MIEYNLPEGLTFILRSISNYVGLSFSGVIYTNVIKKFHNKTLTYSQ